MTEPVIIIGGPAYKRELWLPFFFRKIIEQTWPLSNLGFIFNVAPDDDATVSCLLEFAENHPEVRCFEILVNKTVSHRTNGVQGERSWNLDRYATMAQLRNEILDNVKSRCPDRFFSLDSDIFLDDPETIQKLYELDLDLVSPLCFMTPEGDQFPNVMSWASGKPGPAFRDTQNYPLGTLFRADVIMAAVMMKPVVYTQLRYSVHRQGEDLSLSSEAFYKDIKLYSASYLRATHVMTPVMLAKYSENA